MSVRSKLTVLAVVTLVAALSVYQASAWNRRPLRLEFGRAPTQDSRDSYSESRLPNRRPIVDKIGAEVKRQTGKEKLKTEMETLRDMLEGYKPGRPPQADVQRYKELGKILHAYGGAWWMDDRAIETEPNDDCTSADFLDTFEAMLATVDPSTDEDFFYFEISLPGVYVVETSPRNYPDDLTDSRMWLYNDDCSNELEYDDDSGQGLYSKIVFTHSFPPQAVYKVKVTSYNSSYTGDYYLTVTGMGACNPVDAEPANDDCSTTPHYLNCDLDSIALTHPVETDVDWVEFTLTETKKIAAWTGPCGGSDDDTKIWLYEDDCTTEIAYNDDGGPGGHYFSGIGYPCDANGIQLDAGTYFLKVGHYDWDLYLDDYYLYLECCETSACPPEPVEAELFCDYDSSWYQIEVPYDEDWFEFNGTAGQTINFYLAPCPQGYIDSKITLYDYNCNELTSNDDGGPWGSYPYYMSGIMDYSLSYTGTYYIMAESSPYWNPGGIGYYAMVLDCPVPYQCPPPDHPDWLVEIDYDPPDYYPIECGDTICGWIDAPSYGDWDLYAFETTDWNCMTFDAYANDTPGWPPYMLGLDTYMYFGYFVVSEMMFYYYMYNDDNYGPPGPYGYDSRIKTSCWPPSDLYSPVGEWWILVTDYWGTTGPYVLATECLPCEPTPECTFIDTCNPDLNEGATFWADAEYVPPDRLYWIKVGGDNHLHVIDHHTCTSIADCEIPYYDSVGNTVSMRGVAYDQHDQTIWVGRWNWNWGTSPDILQHITDVGDGCQLLSEFTYDTTMPIAGLAMDNDNRHLWVVTNGQPDQFFEFDVSTGIPVLLQGPIAVPWYTECPGMMFDYSAGGLEYNEGTDMLLAINQGNNTAECFNDNDPGYDGTGPEPGITFSNVCELGETGFAWGVAVVDGGGDYGLGELYTIDIAGNTDYGPFPVQKYRPPCSFPGPTYFIHITDTHVGSCRGAERFDSMVDCINAMYPPPAFVVISGDLVDVGGMGVNYNLFNIIASGLSMPYFTCPGNHDYYCSFGYTCPTGIENYQYYVRPDLDYEFIHLGIELISMDSGYDVWEVPSDLPSLPPEGSGIWSSQLEWLRQRLLEHPELSKIVFMHHPVVCYCTQCDLCDLLHCSDGCISRNREDLVALLRDQNEDGDFDDAVKVILSGHTHEPFEYMVIGDFVFPFSIPYGQYVSTDECQFLPLYIVTDAVKDKGYRKIEVHNGELRIFPNSYFGCTGVVSCHWSRPATRSKNDTIPAAAVRLHAYDSNGNHVGINDVGSIDIDIEGAYYDDLSMCSDTGAYCWNRGEQISVVLGVQCYVYVFEAMSTCTLRVKGKFIKENDGRVMLSYRDIEASEGSIGRLFIDGYSVDYTLYLDDDGDGIIDREIQPDEVICEQVPYRPAKPSGPIMGHADRAYSYSTSTADPEGDQVYFIFNWGDGTESGWLGPYSSGDTCTAPHIWTEPDTYNVRVKAKDVWDHVSDWSKGLSVCVLPGVDVYVTSKDIRFYPDYPFPADSVNVFGTVHCDTASGPVDSVLVQFYDGNPDQHGLQIDGDQVARHILSGDYDTVHVSWIFPDSVPHAIYVVVDPDNELREYNEENNKAVRIYVPTVPATVTMTNGPDWPAVSHPVFCYIELPGGYDPKDIRIETILLTGANGDIAPTQFPDYPWEVGDYDEDGVLDLMVTFDNAEITEIVDPDSLMLTLTGKVDYRGSERCPPVKEVPFEATLTPDVGFGNTMDYLVNITPIPKVTFLGSNQPNPFRFGTSISYGIAKSSTVTLKMYDATGRMVATLVNTDLEPGYYTAYWDGKDQSAQKTGTGIYFYRLLTDDFTSTKKMILLH